MLVGLLISAVTFTILYTAMMSNLSFLKCLIVYIVCCEIDLAIRAGGMSVSLFLLSFGIYFFTGLIVVNVLQGIRDSWGLKGFIIIGIVIQSLISLVLDWLN